MVNVGYGAFAVLSEDNGKTWDNEHPILLGVAPNCYCGWPVSVQLTDGRIVTNWSGAAAHIVRWQLPPPSEGWQGE